jgi:hypothetical protein
MRKEDIINPATSPATGEGVEPSSYEFPDIETIISQLTDAGVMRTPVVKPKAVIPITDTPEFQARKAVVETQNSALDESFRVIFPTLTQSTEDPSPKPKTKANPNPKL